MYAFPFILKLTSWVTFVTYLAAHMVLLRTACFWFNSENCNTHTSAQEPFIFKTTKKGVLSLITTSLTGLMDSSQILRLWTSYSSLRWLFWVSEALLKTHTAGFNEAVHAESLSASQSWGRTRRDIPEEFTYPMTWKINLSCVYLLKLEWSEYRLMSYFTCTGLAVLLHKRLSCK